MKIFALSLFDGFVTEVGTRDIEDKLLWMALAMLIQKIV